MAFFKHRYEVREVIQDNRDEGWSSAIVRYIGEDERKANSVYKELKAKDPTKKVEIIDYVWF